MTPFNFVNGSTLCLLKKTHVCTHRIEKTKYMRNTLITYIFILYIWTEAVRNKYIFSGGGGLLVGKKVQLTANGNTEFTLLVCSEEYNLFRAYGEE